MHAHAAGYFLVRTAISQTRFIPQLLQTQSCRQSPWFRLSRDWHLRALHLLHLWKLMNICKSWSRRRKETMDCTKRWWAPDLYVSHRCHVLGTDEVIFRSLQGPLDAESHHACNICNIATENDASSEFVDVTDTVFFSHACVCVCVCVCACANVYVHIYTYMCSRT